MEFVCIEENVSMNSEKFKHGTLINVMYSRKNKPSQDNGRRTRLPYGRCTRMKDCPMVYRK